MTPTHDPADPRTDDGLPPDLVAMAERLQAGRPIPDPQFRGRLGRRLSRSHPAGQPVELGVIRRRIAALAGSGGALFAFALAGLAGVGPLGA